MSVLLDLPDALIKTIVCEWLTPPAFVHLDTALCNTGLREKFLKFIHDSRGNPDNRLLLCNAPVVEFKFPTFDSGSYGERNPILDIIRYAEKRNIGLRHVKLSQWPYFGIDSIWQTFLDGVSALQILGPETDDAPITNALLQTYAGFRNVHDVHLVTCYSYYVPLSKWCVQMLAMWPKLTKLTLDCGSSCELSLHTEDRLTGNIPHASTSSIPAPLFESLNAVCSRLTELRLLDIMLYPVDVFTLFGDITMLHLESLELRSTSPETISTAYYTDIQLSHPRHHLMTSTRNDIVSHVQPEAVTDAHDISFATAAMPPTFGDNEGLPHRPRHRVSTQITSLDEFCGYFAQSRRGTLPNLRKLSGDCRWTYALLPLATTASLRTLELNADTVDVGAIWSADSAFGLHIPSLRNVTSLAVRISCNPIGGKSFPVDVFLANMPLLESVILSRYCSFYSVASVPDDSFATSFCNLTQPMSRLRNLHLSGYVAQDSMEMHTLFERLSHIAPQLRELGCYDLEVKLPCLFYSLRNNVSLQSLDLQRVRVDSTLTPPSWKDLDLLRTDLAYLCQLTNLFRVRISDCGVYVRDALLIQVFKALPHLAEFCLRQTSPANEYLYFGDDDDYDEENDDMEDGEDEDDDEDEGENEEDEDEDGQDEDGPPQCSTEVYAVSTASETGIITRDSVLLRDPLPPLNTGKRYRQ